MIAPASSPSRARSDEPSDVDHADRRGEGIPARHIDFEAELRADRVPLDWFANDPFATAVVSGLSVMFPDGESFFVEAVRACRGAVTDEQLAAQVSAFVLQEAMHGKGHRAFNEMLLAQGHEAARDFEDEVRAFLGVFRRRLPPTSRLAITCALEHFTALLAEELLENPELRACLDPSVRPMWLWHALEEAEHKAVAFDVYEANDGGYLHRNAIMILTTIFFLGMMVRGGSSFRRSRRSLEKAARLSGQGPTESTSPKRGLREDVVGWGRVLDFVARKPGIFRKLVPGYLAYFRPGFHPQQRDARALIGAWRAELFGESGPLFERVTPLRVPTSRVGRSPSAVPAASASPFVPAVQEL